jgi:hypothetical protein
MMKKILWLSLLFYVCNYCQSPSVPSGLLSFSYEKHIELEWNPNTETNIAGYRIYKWNGLGYTLSAIVTYEKNDFIEFISQADTTNYYKISAYSSNGFESAMSDSVSAAIKSMTDDDFLTMVQRATFRYFYDYAHPVSGLARDRLGGGNTVTIGGSGFGISALLVGIERGFISRSQGVERMLKILNFLSAKADRFHGAFPHFLNGETGQVIPFSQYDDGGDLVETSFMIQGLLTSRQYFNLSDSNEVKIRNLITSIWDGVEWTWYKQVSFSNFLYWHWSPNYGWQINLQLKGWNETMICYLLGIASPTYKLPASMYYKGWASDPNYSNGNTYYGYKLWVGPDYGGPLFFAHYSFLGFDPRFKKDNFANYFNNNRDHTLINRAYCITNPKGFTGYGENVWGLTASDDPFGYAAHEPYNVDNGTITPTAALSSMPYTPQESISLLKYLYRTYTSDLWGDYGFKDAFNPQQNWFASSYLAIDQGPIIAMIENYRTQLLWNNFMANPEIQSMVDSVFVPDSTTSVNEKVKLHGSFYLYGNYPNPFNPSTTISFFIPANGNVEINIYDILGIKVKSLLIQRLNSGDHNILWNGKNDYGSELTSGIYLYRIKFQDKVQTGKLVLQK